MGFLLNRYDTPEDRWRRIGNRISSGWQCQVEGCAYVLWQDERPEGTCPACGSKRLKGVDAATLERREELSVRSFFEGGRFDDGWR